MSPQGDVPRQLGWSAADHWGLAAWMNGKSSEKLPYRLPKKSEIGHMSLVRMSWPSLWVIPLGRGLLHFNVCMKTGVRLMH